MAYKIVRILILFLWLIFSGCAYHQKILSEETRMIYLGWGTEDNLVLQQSPLFLVYDDDTISNRIGRPSAKYDDQGKEQIHIDTETPIIYYLKRDFTTKKGSSTSFYYGEGVLKGYVQGSVKPWETILLSLISFDFFVGTDKAYADSNETGNRFYTNLMPWNQRESDMWNFSEFLKFWGWKL